VGTADAAFEPFAPATTVFGLPTAVLAAVYAALATTGGSLAGQRFMLVRQAASQSLLASLPPAARLAAALATPPRICQTAWLPLIAALWFASRWGTARG
jgi:hypothetical protein